MHPITTNPQWPKESYSWAEAVPDASRRPGKPGQDFGENGDCLQQRGREAGVSHGDASRSQNLSRTRVEGGGGGFSQDRTQRGAPSCLRVPTPGLAREAAGGRARELGFAVSCAQCTSEVFLGCISPCRCTLVYLTIHFD